MDSTTQFGGNLRLCDDCKKGLTQIELDHGLEGFGHFSVCCDCYDYRMGKPRPLTPPEK